MQNHHLRHHPVLAVASGKGGTGKTTVTVNLAHLLGETEPVQVIDCDVEEPDARLFLPGTCVEKKVVTTRIPRIDPETCQYCSTCSSFCQFRALAVAPKVALVFPELCHGCCGCATVCPVQAITMTEHRVGIVETTFVNERLTVVTGLLDVGYPMAGPVIQAARKHQRPEILTLLDAPPGTSCPVVESLRNVDYALLVTEPTPFGLHDLSLIVELARLMKIPFCVVVNRHRKGENRIHSFCEENAIEIGMTIPDDKRYASAGARGLLLIEEYPELRERFLGLANHIRKKTT